MEIIKIAISKINPAPYNPRLDLKPGDAEYEKTKRAHLYYMDGMAAGIILQRQDLNPTYGK